jgi:hypothetical protein
MSVTKPAKFDRHSNVKDLLSAMDSDAPDINLNARYKFIVKVGNKYAMRDLYSAKRYSLTDKECYFTAEPHAREALALYKNQGAILIKENY